MLERNEVACEMATNAYRLASCSNCAMLLYSLDRQSHGQQHRPHTWRKEEGTR
jgi:hypothetical protein